MSCILREYIKYEKANINMSFEILSCNCTIFPAEFPANCKKFNGPHTSACYEEIWKNVGCMETGTDWPEKLTVAELGILLRMNLR